MWGKTGINCFVMITGYFVCKSNITLRKFLKLLLEVEFYKIVIYLVFVISGYEPFGIKSCIKALLPVKSLEHNFVGCFLVFYLFIPFLNMLIRSMDRKMHFRLMLLCLFSYTIMGSLPLFHVIMNYVSWFCVLYIIASYIRLYGLFPRISNSQWGWITLCSVLLSIASVVSLLMINSIIGKDLDQYRLVSDSNSILAVVTAVCSFMYFKDLKIRQNRLINTIAASTFGVLLIHANSDTMRTWLWKDTLDNAGMFSTDGIYSHAILSVLVIFSACILLDYLRIHSFEKWVFGHIDKKININKSNCQSCQKD